MIFSKNSRKAPHLLSLLVAFAVAVGMWYVVSVRDRLEVQLEVGIEYNGIPSGLVVTDGLVSKVQVRLRGPEILLRSISSRSLTEAINLSNIKKGTTIVPLTSDNMGPSLRAFELVDVQPPRIVITADTLAERSVPIRAVLESPLRSGALTVENVTVSPASVTLRGPEGVISSINNLPLGIRLDPKAAGTTVEQTAAGYPQPGHFQPRLGEGAVLHHQRPHRGLPPVQDLGGGPERLAVHGGALPCGSHGGGARGPGPQFVLSQTTGSDGRPAGAGAGAEGHGRAAHPAAGRHDHLESLIRQRYHYP